MELKVQNFSFQRVVCDPSMGIIQHTYTSFTSIAHHGA
jgi:hypothetical protein